METNIYNQKGEKAGSLELPKAVFGLPWNSELVHQIVVAMFANRRAPIAHTKGRGDVRGGGKKPWQQKGTGRARHGSSRSPIWIGGGVTFGPTKERNFSKKINKKMGQKAFFTALSQKVRDNEVLFVDELNIKDKKTKEASSVLKSFSKLEGFEKISTKKKNAAFIAFDKKNGDLKQSFNNIPGIETGEARNLNLLDLLSYKYLIIPSPKEGIKILESRTK